METEAGLGLTGALYFSAQRYKEAGDGREESGDLDVSSVEETTCKQLFYNKFLRGSHFNVIFQSSNLESFLGG